MPPVREPSTKTRSVPSGTAKISLARSRPAQPAIRPARSNAGGALRGQARAAQVHAMNAARKTAKGPGPTKATVAAADKRRGIVTQNGARYFKSTGLPVGGGSAKVSMPSQSRSPGFNPFGVPAGKMLDAIINSKRKR